ncbi:unnamed protein product, partial [Amoebophrya sp. A120]|eukprot:GSA120T00013269001.1
MPRPPWSCYKMRRKLQVFCSLLCASAGGVAGLGVRTKRGRPRAGPDSGMEGGSREQASMSTTQNPPLSASQTAGSSSFFGRNLT